MNADANEAGCPMMSCAVRLFLGDINADAVADNADDTNGGRNVAIGIVIICMFT
jgi:hypothetical protein